MLILYQYLFFISLDLLKNKSLTPTACLCCLCNVACAMLPVQCCLCTFALGLGQVKQSKAKESTVKHSKAQASTVKQSKAKAKHRQAE
jgi:hypothetical protein